MLNLNNSVTFILLLFFLSIPVLNAASASSSAAAAAALTVVAPTFTHASETTFVGAPYSVQQPQFIQLQPAGPLPQPFACVPLPPAPVYTLSPAPTPLFTPHYHQHPAIFNQVLYHPNPPQQASVVVSPQSQQQEKEHYQSSTLGACSYCPMVLQRVAALEEQNKLRLDEIILLSAQVKSFEKQIRSFRKTLGGMDYIKVERTLERILKAGEALDQRDLPLPLPSDYLPGTASRPASEQRASSSSSGHASSSAGALPRAGLPGAVAASAAATAATLAPAPSQGAQPKKGH